jgi:DNA-binding transcriptional MerR regulator
MAGDGDQARMSDNLAVFSIGELAEQFGITTRTIRFYEDRGLLSPARVNGIRSYSRRDRARLALILRSKKIGASLQEVAHYIDLYGHKGEGLTAQTDYLIRRCEEAIADLDERRRDIEATLGELRLILDEARAYKTVPSR